MRRHTQLPGVRNWYGEDFLELQGEPLKILDNFFTQYGQFVVSGCEVTPAAEAGKYDIAPGLVALTGKAIDGSGDEVSYVVPFNGANSKELPYRIKLGGDPGKRPYVKDDEVKPVYYDYTAEEAGPDDPTAFEINATGTVNFTTMMADSLTAADHRFVTTSQIEKWDNKVDQIPGKGLSTNDFDENYKLILDVYKQLYFDSKVILIDNTEDFNVALDSEKYDIIILKEGIYDLASNVKTGTDIHNVTVCPEPGKDVSINMPETGLLTKLYNTHFVGIIVNINKKSISTYGYEESSFRNCKLNIYKTTSIGGLIFNRCEIIYDANLNSFSAQHTFNKCNLNDCNIMYLHNIYMGIANECKITNSHFNTVITLSDMRIANFMDCEIKNSIMENVWATNSSFENCNLKELYAVQTRSFNNNIIEITEKVQDYVLYRGSNVYNNILNLPADFPFPFYNCKYDDVAITPENHNTPEGGNNTINYV